MINLSKSQYIRGLQCHKSLWLYKNRQDLRDTPDNQTESAFNVGHDVGELAKELFPNGVEIEFDSSDFNGMIEKTKELIANGTEIIYEATLEVCVSLSSILFSYPHQNTREPEHF